ncbi:hypothetical protein Tco_0708784 [Tanacetum coccineum]
MPSSDVLGFWKSKENHSPVSFPVQSSHGHGYIKTRLTPESLEMCMCLKDHLDAQERKQNTSPLELPLDVEEGVFNDEVQQNEAPTYDQENA